MKNLQKILSLKLLLLAFVFIPHSSKSCQNFGGGNQATVIVCEGYTFVYSGFVDFGACEGPSSGCHGMYQNQ